MVMIEDRHLESRIPETDLKQMWPTEFLDRITTEFNV